ncbi:MAG: hypothetical protein ACRDTM_07425 [Micromonosporaceae bacterium]
MTIHIARAVTTSIVTAPPSATVAVIVPACRSTVDVSNGGPPMAGRTW